MLVIGEERDRALGEKRFSTALMRLASGISVHPELDHICGPLKYSYEPEDFSPRDLDVVPLWEGNSSITGFVEAPDGVVFVRYEVEYLDQYEVVARTEFGLWVDLFRRSIDESFAREIGAAAEVPDLDEILSAAYGVP